MFGNNGWDDLSGCLLRTKGINEKLDDLSLYLHEESAFILL